MKRAIAVLAVCAVLIGVTHAQGNNRPNATPAEPNVRNITHAKQVQEVYDVCNTSRISATITENDGCVQLQDRYNMEFLCMERNTSPQNHCWVEAK